MSRRFTSALSKNSPVSYATPISAVYFRNFEVQKAAARLSSLHTLLEYSCILMISVEEALLDVL